MPDESRSLGDAMTTAAEADDWEAQLTGELTLVQARAALRELVATRERAETQWHEIVLLRHRLQGVEKDNTLLRELCDLLRAKINQGKARPIVEQPPPAPGRATLSEIPTRYCLCGCGHPLTRRQKNFASFACRGYWRRTHTGPWPGTQGQGDPCEGAPIKAEPQA